jgi:hypothetical protein
MNGSTGSSRSTCRLMRRMRWPNWSSDWIVATARGSPTATTAVLSATP